MNNYTLGDAVAHTHACIKYLSKNDDDQRNLRVVEIFIQLFSSIGEFLFALVCSIGSTVTLTLLNRLIVV